MMWSHFVSTCNERRRHLSHSLTTSCYLDPQGLVKKINIIGVIKKARAKSSRCKRRHREVARRDASIQIQRTQASESHVRSSIAMMMLRLFSCKWDRYAEELPTYCCLNFNKVRPYERLGTDDFVLLSKDDVFRKVIKGENDANYTFLAAARASARSSVAVGVAVYVSSRVGRAVA